MYLVLFIGLALLILIAGLALLDAYRWKAKRTRRTPLDMRERVRALGPRPTGLTVIIERIGNQDEQP